MRLLGIITLTLKKSYKLIAARVSPKKSHCQPRFRRKRPHRKYQRKTSLFAKRVGINFVMLHSLKSGNLVAFLQRCRQKIMHNEAISQKKIEILNNKHPYERTILGKIAITLINLKKVFLVGFLFFFNCLGFLDQEDFDFFLSLVAAASPSNFIVLEKI